MIRATLTRSIITYLSDRYSGPIQIANETASDELFPPYAVVRVGSADAVMPGQVDLWDMNLLVGVFHDADATTAETAELQAAELFNALADGDDVISSVNSSVVLSMFQRISTEASIQETRWQHIAGFRTIAAPPLD